MLVYDFGEPVELSAIFSVGGASVDPTTLRLTVKPPSGAAQAYDYPAPPIVRDAEGAYRAIITADQAGVWVYEWAGTGAAADVETGIFLVAASVVDGDPIRPTTDEVARLLKARTGRAIDDDSPAGGTFTDTTNPTAAEVEGFIDIAVIDVRSRVGVTIRDDQLLQARNLAAIWAAVLAELSAVAAGTAEDTHSVAPQYTAAYLARLEDLKAACRRGAVRLA